ncbi:pantetheine-phosphate adenylyltransferase [Azospirillum sp. RWY-5-1]|uniref:Phosphopantetheine adenylyltransferase n=1 Tax=Azospirillum oleiclasticum TaxID=2735135 RepID=A0ABX2TAR0_9PROT|nr:pantetheine-phosphate adenylyltransferase [Azospirillum oleiclasticum]NYZ17812.1 pantetheine-phosphate adenylyltransferase [Azospirillum oleiclasticum]NYZ21431.1 pantetheine-phosphate adenylyltransferase [Azospirillum oleiclasticum]
MIGDTGRHRTAVYAGTFDPVTNGHLDIVVRAARLVDRLVVAVHRNAGKGPLFTLDERVAMIEGELAVLPTGATAVEVLPFDGLLVDFARSLGAGFMVRGLRAVSDFEYEFQMAGMNAHLDRGIETLFLMASDGHQFIASRLVKEVASLGGNVSRFVPPRVAQRLTARILGPIRPLPAVAGVPMPAIGPTVPQ